MGYSLISTKFAMKLDLVGALYYYIKVHLLRPLKLLNLLVVP